VQREKRSVIRNLNRTRVDHEIPFAFPLAGKFRSDLL